MQLRLMDILADPDNPEQWPLKLKVFKSEIRNRKVKPHAHETTGLLCKFFCQKFEKFLVSDPLGKDEKTLPREELSKITALDTCYECVKEEIIDGILYHENEKRLKWFIIDREIPVMYPLELREKKMEEAFINRYEAECKDIGITQAYEDS